MRRLLDPIRSVFFNIGFYGFTVFFLGLYVLPISLFGGEKAARHGVKLYCSGCLLIARFVMGIRVEYRFSHPLPSQGGIIIAAAHQSSADPMILYALRPDVTALAKKELFQLPIIGNILKAMRIIRIDRQSGQAHKEMTRVAETVREEGRALLIYPEATRVKPGTRRPLKSGSYHLAEATGLPVYTIATNTGLFWRKGFFHRSGTMIFEVCGQIDPKAGKEIFMQALEKDIIDASHILIKQAGFEVNLAPKS